MIYLKIAMANGCVTYRYVPDGWSQDKFLSEGGYTVVFLNYNKISQISESAASALRQDFPILEMIFMDDASTDGSGDLMETIVKQYKGRHKLLVVRNDTNQRITGQWNIASKIATGHWLGMFCGDDIADVDRVSKVHSLIRQNPTLKGICTSGREINYLSGKCGRKLDGIESGVNVETGADAISAIVEKNGPICGATAFWHKALFKDRLPSAPYDDVLLRWVLQYIERSNSNPIWMWNADVETISYGVGTGTSSDGIISDSSNYPEWRLWLAKSLHNRKYHLNMEKTWTGILEYYNNHAAPSSFTDIAKAKILLYHITGLNTIQRLALLPSVLNTAKPYRMRTIAYLAKVFVQEFFGLRFAAHLTCLYHKVRGKSYLEIYKSKYE